MARARFPGKPLRLQQRRRVRLLSRCPDAAPRRGEPKPEPKPGPDPRAKGDNERRSAVADGDSEEPRQKMQAVKKEAEKINATPTKKTVTFGAVESCGDSFKPAKRPPIKSTGPLVSIIKKKSALRPTESCFRGIVKPAKLTDLGSKTCLDFGALRAQSPPAKRSVVRFSDARGLSPPPSETSEGRGAHSSRTVKPNKRLIDGDDAQTDAGPTSVAKVLKKPKLILNQADANGACHDEAYETCDSSANSNDSSDSKNFDPCRRTPVFFGKTLGLFGSTANKTPGASFQDTFANGLKISNGTSKNVLKDDSETPRSEPVESHDSVRKDGISKSLLQASRNVSETPCTSDQSSSSTASESSESEESLATSESEESEESDAENNITNSEKSQAPSQLLSGKVVLREARLQLNNCSSGSTGSEGPFSSFGGNQNNSTTNPIGTVTCGVCGAVRFYRFVRQARKFGIYSCESCRKFISKMIKRQNIAQTSNLPYLKCSSGEGNCRVPPIVRSQQWKLLRCAYNARCHACWLKMCIKAFQVPAPLKSSLQMMLPPYMRPSSNKHSPLAAPAATPLLLNAASTFSSKVNNNSDSQDNNSFSSLKNNKTPISELVKNESEECDKASVEKHKGKEESDSSNRKRRHTRNKVRKKDKISIKAQSDSTKRQKVELKGPRVKHVCRSASIVLGQPFATFPHNEDKDLSDVSDDGSTVSEKSTEEPKDMENDLPELCIDCDDKDDPPKDELLVNEASLKLETDTVKDDESSDSFDSLALKEVNKENISDLKSNLDTDSEKDNCDSKHDMEPPSDVILPRKQTKQFGSLSNVRISSKQKFNQRPSSETISTDFWESYDPDEVCNTGWGLISTTPFSVSGVCFLCGSRGKEKLIHCGGCCEMYHPYCAEVNEDSGQPWLCPRCVQCRGCGRNGAGPASAVCRACHRHFHSDCLVANRTPKYRSDWPQICSMCLKCKSCESFKVAKFLGNLPFCTTCFRLRQKGNYCPLCQGCYQDNDFDSKMMECGWCSRWVHARCEGLSGEGYQLVSALPHSVEYICKQCLPENAPWRNMLKTYLRGKLLCVLKALAKNKNACTLLKLTPHKNTPINKRPCMCISPTAIRKLQFDENSAATDDGKGKVQDAEGTNDLQEKTKGTVHKLQESLLQNKEICLSMGHCSSLEGSVNQSNEPCKMKDCCLKMKEIEQFHNTLDSDIPSCKLNDEGCVHKSEESDSKFISSKCICSTKHPDLSPSLLDIKTRVNSNEYFSVKDFNKDMLEVISKTLSPEIKQIYKDVFTELFPWFNCELNCLNPSLEIEDDNDEEIMRDDELSDYTPNRTSDKLLQKANVDDEQTVPSLQNNYKSLANCSYEDENFYDDRVCVLCKIVGEGNPSMEERLLYCGQGDWIHANCALWSAEVFEEIDGSLQNVQSAIARGKMIKCSKCSNKGASVGCCAKNCSETYHFTCARTVGCALLDDKRVFCPLHVDDAKDKTLQKDNDFVLSRPVYVELDRKKKKYCDSQKVQFLLGSLMVKHLGKIVPSVSDFEDMLIPADFLCARLYWSSKQPWKIVKYTIRTKLLLVEPTPAFDLGVNITLDHSLNPNTVDRILAEIESWHKSLELESHNMLVLKKDKSPIKFGNVSVSLEDYAVKQVMEYMLDIVCKQDQNDDAPEEEPQNTADLLPPELKDAIFEDLNHDLLDGISMQDIFPKFCYEDLVAMDLKNEVGFVEVSKENKLAENTDDTATKSDEISVQEKLKKSVYLSNINVDQMGDNRNLSQDFLEEIISNQNEAVKELKKSKSELMLHGVNLKSLTANRNHQRTGSLTLNYKIDNAFNSNFKRCKFPRPNFLTRSDGGGNVVMIVDGTSDLVSNISSSKLKIEEIPSCKIVEEKKDVSGNNASSPFLKNLNDHESANELRVTKTDKSDVENEQVIDFYTKMRCSPISQLDGADDFSCSSDSSSPPMSPCGIEDNIPQLDGADDVSSSSSSESGSPPRDQNATVFFRPNNMDNTYTMTISATNLNNVISTNEILMRTPLEEMIRPGQNDQMVKCDRCHCTYRTKDSYNRHLPTCDLMSTSESEGETPKSPESRTLTTLQNAFGGPFITPTYINQQSQVYESTDQFNITNPALVTARRTSVNTRQITINGTIVETPPPRSQSPMKSNHLDSNNCQDMGVNIKTSFLHESPKITLGQGILSPSQIMVAANLPVSPPRNQVSNGSKCTVNNQNNMPYSICVKPNTGLHTIQTSNPTIAHMIPNSGQIQTVFSSNPGQVLTIANPSQNIIQNIQGKTPIVQTFANIQNGQTIAVPVNALQGLSSSNNNGINAFVRPSIPIPSTSTILMSSANAPRITSPNIQQKNQILLPQMGQKSPKKLQQVQPKPIFQATRGRGRTVNKAVTNKRPNKPEKTLTAINPAIGPGGAVLQFQPNGNSSQPSIILQQVANPNVMSAYVEAIQQQSTGPNMQYIATIAPQGDYKPAPTHYITQGGIMPQTFQIQQTESGLVAVPSGGIPVFLPQGGVGILPQSSLQSQGMSISSQGNLQTPNVNSMLPQGTIQTQNGATILPQATIQTPNGATIIPQGATIQTISQGSTPTLLPSNNMQSQGPTIVPHNGINNSQNIIPQPNLSNQNNTIISQQPGTTIIPQGTILPQGLQFCNDQVLLGSTPTLEMVTDSSGCMYLTTQPVYYGLETIVQNTVMSSQQFVSTAMQGVLAQNSSFSATTTQVFQASKIEPIVEMPAGYVVVNNVPQDNIVVSQPNSINSQAISLSNGNVSIQPASMQKNKTLNGPNITIQPSDKPVVSAINRTGNKNISIQPNQPVFSITPHQVGNTLSLQSIQPRNITISQGKQNISLQPMHSSNISVPVSAVPQSTQSSHSSENIHLHIGQSIMSTSTGNSNTSLKTTLSMGQLNQFNSPENGNGQDSHISQNLLHQQGPKTNFSQQGWKPNQNFITDGMTKNQSIIIQSNESPNNNNQKNNPNIISISNTSNLGNNIIGNVKNYPFNQIGFSDGLQTKMNSQIGNSNSNHSSQNSYCNAVLQNNNFSMSGPPTSSQYINSGSITHMTNNNINVLSSNSNINMIKGSDNVMAGNNQGENNQSTNKSTNLHQICSVQRGISTPVSENSNNGTNIIHLPNNMMNLSLQNGKIYQIPINSNSLPHMTLNSTNSSHIQNQINCNLQNNTMINQNGNNSSNTVDHMINAQNSFSVLSGNMNQINCMNNQMSNSCNQHQLNLPNCHNQPNGGSHQLHNHMINSQQLNNPNNNVNQINQINAINQMQIVNNHNQIQMPCGNVNMNTNFCSGNNRNIIGDNVSIMNNNTANDLNKMINDPIDRNIQMGNMNVQMSNKNINSNNMNSQNFNSNNQIVHDSQSNSESNISNNISQYHINSDQMFLINNSPNIQLNTLNNVQNRFQTAINQSNSTVEVQNQAQGNEGNQLSHKMPQKQDSFETKMSPIIGTIQTDSDQNKMSIGKQNNSSILSLPPGSQIGYIQMNGSNGQILSFGDNRMPYSNNMGGHIQNQRPPNTPILTIGQNDISRSSPSRTSPDGQRKNNDMPSLAISVNSDQTPIISNPSNNINKQIHLPQHNISGNCINNSINFSLSSNNIQGFSNLQMKNNNINQINLPAQNGNSTISLPTQNTSNITLPKAPPHQTGIPTNVVNPIPYMRPMNRVLPIHRDAQSTKMCNRQTKTKVEPPKPSPRCQDMPDLNTKDEEMVTNDVEKAIRESKLLTEQKKTEIVPVESNPPVESIPTPVQVVDNVDEHNKLKASNDIEMKIENGNNSSVEPCIKLPQKALRDISTNLIKDPLQKLETKLSKDDNIIPNLKTQNINQRKVQIRSKIGSENIHNMKLSKPPPARIFKEEGPKMIYEISSEDGFSYSSTSLSELWNKVIEAVQNARKLHGLPIIKFGSTQNMSNAHILGLHNNALKYLVEQLPGAGRCVKYKAKHGSKNQNGWDSDIGVCESFRESSWGSARAGPAVRKSSADMFSWLSSPYREPPPPLNITQDDSIISRRVTSTTLPMAMRFRNLKETSKHSVGVYRSHIHGRGLFCRRDIEAGEMVIEYAGEVIRAALADQRERRYEAARGSRGVTGCYMFRVDDHLVVDATMKGNAARFINHSCDPNCYSKVVDILGHKHILILALRRIYQGEELTYDYKFPFEEVKIPCSCGAKKCRKYLN